jgi:outer membrane protein TolC
MQAMAQREIASDVAWELRAGAAVAFYELYQLDRGLATARGTLRLMQDIRRVADAMYRVGEGQQADVLRAQVEIARMAEDTIRMTAMRSALTARLAASLDRPAGSVTGTPVLPRFPDTLPSLVSLLAWADTGRPVINAARREVDAAAARSTLAHRELWPDLTLGLQYGQRRGEMGTERMASVMVGASVPVFAGRRQLRMREEASAMRQMAAAELAAMRADTRARIAEAYANLVQARNLAALYRTTIIPQLEATVASALAAYRVGSVDFMTLVDGRVSVRKYQQELFALESAEGRAWADLEMLTGRELFDARHASIAAHVSAAGERK